MPPKNKFTRDQIVSAALELVREAGIEAVTARSLAERLGASTRPIFGYFDSMEALHEALVRAAKDEYNRYVAAGLADTLAFKGVGMQYIAFAKREPRLFALLFMSEQCEKNDALGVLPLIDDNYREILDSIDRQYAVGEANAKRLYRHLWLYTHGIATLIATGVCDFSDSEIDTMLTEVFVSLLIKIKGEMK